MNFRLGKTGQISGEYSENFCTNPLTLLCHNCHIMPPLQQSNFRYQLKSLPVLDAPSLRPSVRPSIYPSIGLYVPCYF